MHSVQGWGAWPCAGLSLLKIKKSLIVIQMVRTQKCVPNVSTEITFISQQ